MSTRGLIGFVRNGEVKAKYVHRDSYLSGLGKEIAEFFHKKPNLDQFITAYDTIEWDDREVSNRLETIEGAQILPAILNGQVAMLYDEKEFAKETLFCEYAYLINLDEQELEIYRSGYHENIEKFVYNNLPMELIGNYELAGIPNFWDINRDRSKDKNIDMEL